VKNKQQFLKELQDFAAEKNLPVEKAIDIIIASVKTVWINRYSTDSLKVTYDKKNSLSFQRKLLVVPDSREIVDHISEITLSDAQLIEKKITVSEVILKEVEPTKLFDRVMIEQFKQVFLKNILIYNRDEEYKKFLPMEHTIALGLVKSIKNDNAIIGIEGINTLLPRKESILTEKLREGEKVYVYIKEVKQEYAPGLYQIIVSRKGTELVELLLQNIIPEINNDQIGVHKIVRIPGYKSKICLQKLVDTINPVSVAIGYHGNRVKTLIKELKNEIVEFFEYTNDIKDLISTMLKKLRISPMNIHLNYDKKTITVILKDNDIYTAIGTGGREVTMMRQFLPEDFDRLIFVKDTDNEAGFTGPEYYFGHELNLDNNVTNFLESVGLNSINKIMKMSPEAYYKKLTENDMEKELADLIYERVKLYTQEKLDEFKAIDGVQSDLFMYYNLEPQSSIALASNGVLSVDELLNCPQDIIKKILSYYMNDMDIADLLFQ
jgi:N utilization substance protein A